MEKPVMYIAVEDVHGFLQNELNRYSLDGVVVNYEGHRALSRCLKAFEEMVRYARPE